MIRRRDTRGFSLIELLLVLVIMGILSGIAVPAFMSQRKRARIIGDAQSNAQVLRMQMESYKADAGVYGGAGSSFTWYGASVPTTGAGAAYNFTPKGNSAMKFVTTIGSTGLTYTIQVQDPSYNNYVVYTVNQAGSAVISKY